MKQFCFNYLFALDLQLQVHVHVQLYFEPGDICVQFLNVQCRSICLLLDSVLLLTGIC